MNRASYQLYSAIEKCYKKFGLGESISKIGFTVLGDEVRSCWDRNLLPKVKCYTVHKLRIIHNYTWLIFNKPSLSTNSNSVPCFPQTVIKLIIHLHLVTLPWLLVSVSRDNVLFRLLIGLPEKRFLTRLAISVPVDGSFCRNKRFYNVQYLPSQKEWWYGKK